MHHSSTMFTVILIDCRFLLSVDNRGLRFFFVDSQSGWLLNPDRTQDARPASNPVIGRKSQLEIKDFFLNKNT